MFIMITTTNHNIYESLRQWWTKTSRPYVKEKWMLRKLGPKTYLFELNGATLALLRDLKERYNGDVMISLVEILHGDYHYPEEILKEVKKCRNNKTFLSKETLEKLSKIKPRYSLRLNEK